jgi:hypothetical protein
MKLEDKETDLIGEWIINDGKVAGDATCERIESLISNYLEKIAGGGWDTLYKDPHDGRYWELVYPQSQMHGGGPPRLTNLLPGQAKLKYGIS